MRAHRRWLTAAALVLALGCGNGTPGPILAPRLDDVDGRFEYRADDGSGHPLLVGTVTLAVAQDSSITGTWAMRWAAGADTTAPVGPQVGTGTLAGHAGTECSIINLNPGWADNNVFLVLRRTADGLLAGQWQHSTLVGVVAEGRFELRPLAQ
ncbi:MAG: hypothetical protein ACREMN_07495 [Gemmatimonadales bacterium]